MDPKSESQENAASSLFPSAVRIVESIFHAARRDERLRADISNGLAHIAQLIQPVSATPHEPANTPPAEPDMPDEKETIPVTAFNLDDAPITVGEAVISEIEDALRTGSEGHSVAQVTKVRFVEKTPVQLIEECRLKAEACRWYVERRKHAGLFSDEVRLREKELIRRARRIEHCFLWMSTPYAPQPNPVELYLDLAACFENGAEAAKLLLAALKEPSGTHLQNAMSYLAEAQFAIRMAVTQVGMEEEDWTQAQLFHWLKRLTREHHLFVTHFMRRNESAIPANAPDLAGRIREAAEDIERFAALGDAAKRVIATVSYHAHRLYDEADRRYNWERILETLAEAVPDIICASDPRFRSLLLPHLDTLPEDAAVSASTQTVFDALDQYLPSEPDDVEIDQPKQTTAEMIKLRERLRGTTLVIIGGEARPHAQKALRDAFDLTEVFWQTAKHHQSPTTFRPAIEAEGVSVVLLAIRWSSHVFANVKSYCDEANVPFVRLPAGYSPSQVAAQILQQYPSI
jgi:hypothetical protein